MMPNRPISELPYPTILATKKGLEEFRKMIKEKEETLKDNILESDDYILKIEFLIYIKIIFQLWNIEDYKKFKNIFIKMDTLQIKIFGPSIVKCLEASDYTIYEVLKPFSNQVNWYSLVENQKIRTEWLNFFNILVIRINKYIYNYSLNLLENFDKLKDINDEIKQINFNVFYKDFEEEFAFLKDYSLFVDIYNNMKENSKKKITDCIYMINRNNNIRKENKKKYRVNSTDAMIKTPVKIYSKKFRKTKKYS